MSTLKVKITVEEFDADGDELNSVKIDTDPGEQPFAVLVGRLLGALQGPPEFRVLGPGERA